MSSPHSFTFLTTTASPVDVSSETPVTRFSVRKARKKKTPSTFACLATTSDRATLITLAARGLIKASRAN